jgi:hypothetical protein
MHGSMDQSGVRFITPGMNQGNVRFITPGMD